MAIAFGWLGATLSGCRSDAPELPLLEQVAFPAQQRVNRHTLRIPAGVGALVRIEQQDAESEVAIRSERGVEWLGRIHYFRSVPVMYGVPPSPVPQSIDVHVKVLESNRNAQVSLTAREIPAAMDHSEHVYEALRLYGKAISVPADDEDPDWEQRVGDLDASARLFEGLNLREEALFARFLAAYFTYFYLYDYSLAEAQSRKVASSAKALGLDDLWLQAMIVQAWALVEIAAGVPTEDASDRHDQVQALFGEIKSHSTEANRARQRAIAINGKGADYFYQAKYREARDQFQSALEIATSILDQQLEIQTRGNLALTEEMMGNYDAALVELEEIRNRLADHQPSTGPTAVINNLSELGRLYRHVFDFSEAINVLNEALNLSRGASDIEAQARIAVALAWAYHEMGQADRALATAQMALPLLEESNYKRGLPEIHHIRANIYRHRGQFELMAQSRGAQGALLMNEANTASFLYESAQDLLVANAPESITIAALNKALEAADEVGRNELLTTLRIELCQIELSLKQPAEGYCDRESLGDALDELLRTGLPKWQLRAREEWVNYLVARGNESEALEVLEQMLQDMVVYRHDLPGVLGAWYWENRDRVLDQYIQLTVDRDIASKNAARSFALFNRIRNLELHEPADSADSNTGKTSKALSQELRSLYVRRASLGSDSDLAGIEREIDATMLRIRQQSPGPTPPPADAHSLQAIDGLPATAVLIAWYFAPNGVVAWHANQNGIEVDRLPQSASLQGELELLSSDMRIVGEESLDERLGQAGSRLFGHLGTPLAETVYVLPTGPLFRFPIGALRLNGKYLAEDHQIVSLMSVLGLKDPPGHTGRTFSPRSVFAAGNPISPSGNLQLGNAEKELEALVEQFPSANVSLVQRENFARKTFESRAFQQAELIHIASHATNDLAYPAMSSIALSSTDGSPATLAALDVQELSLSARLVVLSACESSGNHRFRLDGNLGFVTAFLIQGADSVVASLWPISDRKTAEFMKNFYAELARSGSPAHALQRAKQIAISSRAPLRDWAAFQIYTN